MCKKKSIIFVLSSFPSGGVEKSFLSYISLLSPELYEVTVLLIHKTGEWLKYIPSWVRIEEVRLLEEDKRDISLGLRNMFLAAWHRRDWRRLLIMSFRCLRLRARKNGIGSMNSFIMDAVKAGRKLYPKEFVFSYDWVVSYGCYCHSPMVACALLKGRKSAVWFHSEDQFKYEGRGF